jgi:hypothetical protein
MRRLETDWITVIEGDIYFKSNMEWIPRLYGGYMLHDTIVTRCIASAKREDALHVFSTDIELSVLVFFSKEDDKIVPIFFETKGVVPTKIHMALGKDFSRYEHRYLPQDCGGIKAKEILNQIAQKPKFTNSKHLQVRKF